MDETLQSLLGGGLPAGLLTPQQEAAAEQRARNAGLLNLAFGMLQASRGAPGQRAPSLGQVIGQAGPVGVQAYQQSFDQTLQNALRGMQIQEMQRRQKEQEELRQKTARFERSLQGAFTATPSVRGVLDTQTNIDPALLEQMSAQEVIAAAPKTERTLDQGKFMQALAEFSPLEYAKLAFKQSDEPEKIRTLRTLIKDPQLMNAFIETTRAGTQPINIGTKTQVELMTEIYSPQVKQAFEQATQSREFANSAQVVANLLKGKGGGELVRIGTVLSRNLGFGDKETVAAADLAESLATRGAVTMRAPGSGSTSDIEFNAYREAFPSLRNSDEGRQLMAKYAAKFADRAEKIADYKARLLAKGEYSLEAVRKYDESLGSVLGEDFAKFRATTSASQPRDYRGR